MTKADRRMVDDWKDRAISHITNDVSMPSELSSITREQFEAAFDGYDCTLNSAATVLAYANQRDKLVSAMSQRIMYLRVQRSKLMRENKALGKQYAKHLEQVTRFKAGLEQRDVAIAELEATVRQMAFEMYHGGFCCDIGQIEDCEPRTEEKCVPCIQKSYADEIKHDAPGRIAALEAEVTETALEYREANIAVIEKYRTRMSREVAAKLKAAVLADRMGGGVVKAGTAIKHVCAIIDSYTEEP